MVCGDGSGTLRSDDAAHFVIVVVRDGTYILIIIRFRCHKKTVPCRAPKGRHKILGLLGLGAVPSLDSQPRAEARGNSLAALRGSTTSLR